MKSMFKHLLFASALLPLCGCHHKDLEYAEPLASNVEVVFDWRNAPDADPASMAMYLFDNYGQQPMRYIFDNKHGGSVRTPYGAYMALCLNSDYSNIIHLRNTPDIDDFEIYTSEAGELPAQNLPTRGLPRAAGTESEPIVMTPQMMWGSRTDNISLRPTTDTQRITFYPEELVCHYTVDVLDVKNMGSAADASIDATLSSMAGGYRHGSRKATEDRVTMPFTMKVNDSATGLHSEFLTFGECPSQGDTHILSLYMVLADGSAWNYTFDVTRQVSEAPDPRHVHIIVTGLSLPEPLGSGAGFRPNVNEWQTEHIDLQMPF